jgi:hypothetical protein
LACSVIFGLFSLSYRDGALGGPPTDPEAAVATLGSALAQEKIPAGVVACVSFVGPSGREDFPRPLIEDVMSTFPGLHAGSACVYDSKKMKHHLKQDGTEVPMISCGVLRKSPSQSNSVLVECDVFRGGGLNAEGRGFEVHRSFLGTVTVEDIGLLWIS